MELIELLKLYEEMKTHPVEAYFRLKSFSCDLSAIAILEIYINKNLN
jgi:hypothetical protein